MTDDLTTGAASTARRSMRSRRARLAAMAVPAVALALALGACTSAATGSGGSTAGPVTSAPNDPPTTPAPTSSSPSMPSPPIRFTATPKAKTGVNPTAPVTVAVAHGTLRSVRMLNPEGQRVTGKLSADRTSWHTTEVLGYGRTYHIKAQAVGASGETRRTLHRSFTTLTPGNMTMPYFQRIGGYTLDKGATYGVGIVPIVHFDEPIPNKAAAERALEVTTSPHVDGSWYWVDDQNVHWRPKHYYRPGTKVTIHADVYGVEVGRGLYGESDASTSFTIGRKQVTVTTDVGVDPDHPHGKPQVNKVRVYNGAGQVIRTMNTSMGKHGGETVKGNYINFFTLDGTYTVIAHEQPANMCSDSYGLPADAPGGYECEKIYNATKISVDGIYLHELTTTEWDQDHGYDVSHGCLNLNQANSWWFFKHSLIGDPVVIHGAKGAPTLQVWQGGDWTVPWSTWTAGSALD